MHSDIKGYLNNLLTEFDPYFPTEDERVTIKVNVALFITTKLFRKKFRKQKLNPDTIADITKKVALSLKEDRPLHFTIPFGGYKHFWNPSHPEPDWAELFTLRFLTDWLTPVLTVYKPGVILEFISEDLILPRMNNYPEEALNQYAKIFSQLLDIYKKLAPKNLNIRYFRVADKYDKNKIQREVEELLPTSWKKWETYSNEEKGIELKRSRRSVFWKGKEDLTKLDEEEKNNKIIESRLIEMAYYEVEAHPEYFSDYFTRDNHIPICFSFGLSPDNIDNWITLGSTYASTVDFWIGRGILENMGEKVVNRIISKNQYKKLENNLQKADLRLSLLPFKNYQSIEVIDNKVWTLLIKS